MGHRARRGHPKRGTRVSIRALAVSLQLALACLGVVAPAFAHNCTDQSDCQQTAGYNATIAVAGGLLALLAGLWGGTLGGLLGGAEAARVAGGAREQGLQA